ncbi:MAG TPA: hypothetical protein PKE63_02610 [Lacibacter sp.]|nr:hypothetical protein [Lacibacter sp.]HMO89583.1 hypothetical protein [Lacibacter sp.]HMP86138.1 hypothetical protein [Lacibacter sp.]
MMRLQIFVVLLLVPALLWGQKFSGQWSGSFDETRDSSRTEYVLEIEAKGNTFEGTSITYFILGGQRYYTICAIKGKIDPGSKTLVSTEVTKVKANTPAWFRDCFQTHTLTYFKKGNEEQLVGTWKSARKEDNCGTGSTLLSRKMLVKNPLTSPASPSAATRNNPGTQPIAPTAANPKPAAPKTTAPPVSKTKPAQEPEKRESPTLSKIENKVEQQPRTENKPVIPAPKLPNGLERRDNRLFETIYLTEEDIIVSLYDNAEIDGDIITVLFNDEVVVARQTLSDQPITIRLKAVKGRENTLVMYAENQGRVPPNTAIMRVQNGENYYKVFLSADDKNNASVRFRFRQ